MVVEGHQTVQEGAGVTVEGKELEYKDEYIVVQWLELLEGGNGREYFLSDERECIWELTALMPVKKLGRYPIPSDMQNAHRPRKPYELSSGIIKKCIGCIGMISAVNSKAPRCACA